MVRKDESYFRRRRHIHAHTDRPAVSTVSPMNQGSFAGAPFSATIRQMWATVIKAKTAPVVMR